MTISSGTYIIENIQSHNWAVLTNNNDGDDVLSGTDEDEDVGHLWEIKRLRNGTFKLQNQLFRNHASYRLTDVMNNDKAAVLSVRSNPYHWRINQTTTGDVYWISDLDGVLCWTLTSNYPQTPITLEKYTRSNRQHWKLESEEDNAVQALANRLDGSSLSPSDAVQTPVNRSSPSSSDKVQTPANHSSPSSSDKVQTPANISDGSSLPSSDSSPLSLPKVTESREHFVSLANANEDAEEYEEMLKNMKRVVAFNPVLTPEERKLLSVAYKNIAGPLRASLRADEGDKGTREKIESDLTKICEEVLDLLDKRLIPSATSADQRIFFYKMKGDYNRYLAEFLTGDKRKNAAAEALAAMTLATDIAATELPPTDPIRLGLALNFSVFYYEILDKPSRACYIAKAAFDDAIAELDTLSEDTYKDATLIMQLLRDNLTLWTEDT